MKRYLWRCWNEPKYGGFWSAWNEIDEKDYQRLSVDPDAYRYEFAEVIQSATKVVTELGD